MWTHFNSEWNKANSPYRRNNCKKLPLAVHVSFALTTVFMLNLEDGSYIRLPGKLTLDYRQESMHSEVTETSDFFQWESALLETGGQIGFMQSIRPTDPAQSRWWSADVFFSVHFNCRCERLCRCGFGRRAGECEVVLKGLSFPRKRERAEVRSARRLENGGKPAGCRIWNQTLSFGRFFFKEMTYSRNMAAVANRPTEASNSGNPQIRRHVWLYPVTWFLFPSPQHEQPLCT